MPDDSPELAALKERAKGYQQSIAALKGMKDGVDRSKAIAEEQQVLDKINSSITDFGKPSPA